jgi:DNA-binding transcriptional MerR regulator
MKPKDVADRLNMKVRRIQKWAAENGVKYTGEGRRKNYDFTEADIARFLKRDTRRGPKRRAEPNGKHENR